MKYCQIDGNSPTCNSTLLGVHNFHVRLEIGQVEFIYNKQIDGQSTIRATSFSFVFLVVVIV